MTDTKSYLGDILATSFYDTSYYGDTKLFFRHDWMENDLQIHPEWIIQMKEKGKLKDMMVTDKCGINIPNKTCD